MASALATRAGLRVDRRMRREAIGAVRGMHAVIVGTAATELDVDGGAFLALPDVIVVDSAEVVIGAPSLRRTQARIVVSANGFDVQL